MAVNRKHLLELIEQRVARAEERSPGYRHALIDAIADILTLERQHAIQGTNIRQKVADKCDALGELFIGSDSLGETAED